MKLKFFLALILVVLLGGCSLLSQGDEEASFLADASRCNVTSSLSKEQSNRCAKRQKIDAEVARAAQKQAALRASSAKGAGEVYRHAAKPNATAIAAAAGADAAATKYEKFTKRTKLESAAQSGKYKQRRDLADVAIVKSGQRRAKNMNSSGI